MRVRRTCAASTAAVLVVAIAACATSDSSADRARIERLADAERAFAASAATSGVKAAFVAALSDDATLFRPGPVKGRAYIAERPERPYALAWQPQRVAVAASDDLGFSSGPSRFTLAARPGDPQFGQFFSVWRREADGRWALLFDHGSANPGPAGWSDPFEPLVGDGTIAHRSIVEAETDFAERATRDGIGAAYRTFGSTRVRLLRDGVAPIDGAASAGWPEAPASWKWTTIEHGTSRAGDLAWTFGAYRAQRDDRAAAGFYVRVWRAEGGGWKILGDVLAPSDDTR